MSVYIGSATGVVRVGAYRCERYKSRSTCVGAADPYCGWDDARDTCVNAPSYLRDIHFKQDSGHCPVLNMTGMYILIVLDKHLHVKSVSKFFFLFSFAVDGSWSSWSEWAPCVQDNGVHNSPLNTENDKPDTCMCSTRRCNNPKPANGGQYCIGIYFLKIEFIVRHY